jgi:hypothetical protein
VPTGEAAIKRAAVAVATVLALGVAYAPQAAASFHLMKIREVFAGTGAAPSAQYVELQMYEAGQTLVDGHEVRFYDKTGTLQHTETFADNVADGDDNSTILIATQEADDLFGVTPDLLLTIPAVAAAGGKVCFDTIDCVSFGDFTGSATGTGTPFNTPEGIPAGATILRDASGGSNPNDLDPGDDTGDSAADFRFAAPSPKNNAGTTGSNPAGVLNFIGAEFTVAENAGTATITVNRTGGYSAPSDVDYSTLEGTATADDDYTPAAGTLSFSGADPTETFTITIADDADDEGDETVLLRLRNATTAVFGPRLNATLTIDDDEGVPPDETAPLSEITRPDHGSTYRASRLMAFRGTAEDASPIAEVEIALRMTRTNGSCRWYNGTRFVRAGCGAEKWKQGSGTDSWTYSLHHQLSDSKGTKIKHYTLFSRATDQPGNVETTFERSRNSNRFEIR